MIVVVFLSLTSGNISLNLVSSFDVAPTTENKPNSGDEATLFIGDLGAWTGPRGTSGALDFDASLFLDCRCRAVSKNLFCGWTDINVENVG